MSVRQRKMFHPTAIAVLTATMLLLAATTANARPTGEQKCLAAKMKAAAQRAAARVKCLETTILKNLPVDAECLDKADAKFIGAIAKANDVGPCDGPTSALENGSSACGFQLLDTLLDPACGGGRTPCGAICVDLGSSKANCGSCGASCKADEACAGGTCAVPSCSAERTNCSGVCRDLTSDQGNCGACDSPCGVGTACQGGVCVPSACPGTTDCGGVCVDLQTDMYHCGACGFACEEGDWDEGGWDEGGGDDWEDQWGSPACCAGICTTTEFCD